MKVSESAHERNYVIGSVCGKIINLLDQEHELHALTSNEVVYALTFTLYMVTTCIKDKEIKEREKEKEA